MPPGDSREDRLLEIIDQRLAAAHAARPVLGGILIGGVSRRMGRPKQLVEVGGVSMLDRVARPLERHVDRVVLLGSGPVPAVWDGATRLPDPPGVSGPAAGLLAAMRWAPRSAWLLAACDLPRLEEAAVSWLLDQRQPGRWCVLPSLDGVYPEAMLAVYEPQARRLVEATAGMGKGPSRLSGHRAAALVRVPTELRDCWRDADTPDDLPG
jgi:molybdopterin-guanine dinucleotide biosynthesis protein A